MLASVTNNLPSHWLNTIRESPPTATSLSHRVIVSYVDDCKGLPASVLITEAISPLESMALLCQNPPQLPSHSEQNPMWSHCLAYRHLSLTHSASTLLASLLFLNKSKEPHLKRLLYFLIFPSRKFLCQILSQHPSSMHSSLCCSVLCQRGLC